MRNSAAAPAPSTSRRGEYLLGFGILLVIAVVGLFIVKWSPYWARTFNVAGSHTLGNPIMYGAETAPPAASIATMIDYAQRYFLAVWKAMVLGLLPAARVQTLVPR